MKSGKTIAIPVNLNEELVDLVALRNLMGADGFRDTFIITFDGHGTIEDKLLQLGTILQRNMA